MSLKENYNKFETNLKEAKFELNKDLIKNDKNVYCIRSIIEAAEDAYSEMINSTFSNMDEVKMEMEKESKPYMVDGDSKLDTIPYLEKNKYIFNQRLYFVIGHVSIKSYKKYLICLIPSSENRKIQLLLCTTLTIESERMKQKFRNKRTYFLFNEFFITDDASIIIYSEIFISVVNGRIHDCTKYNESVWNSMFGFDKKINNKDINSDSKSKNEKSKKQSNIKSFEKNQVKDIPDKYIVQEVISYSGDPKKLSKLRFEVRWLGYGKEHNTLEPYKNLVNNDCLHKFLRTNKMYELIPEIHRNDEDKTFLESTKKRKRGKEPNE